MKVKKLLIILSFTFGIGGGSSAVAGEITDTEWFMEFLTITYYSGTSAIVNCTAFNSENKPIGEIDSRKSCCTFLERFGFSEVNAAA